MRCVDQKIGGGEVRDSKSEDNEHCFIVSGGENCLAPKDCGRIY